MSERSARGWLMDRTARHGQPWREQDDEKLFWLLVYCGLADLPREPMTFRGEEIE